MKNFRHLSLHLLLLLASIIWSLATNAIPFRGHKIAMSAASPHAIEAGKEISLKGGNATDVAVAMGLTLAVTTPYFAALGGGGFAVYKMKDKVEVLDFREVAPKALHKDYYKEKKVRASIEGGSAIGVPGFLKGLWDLHQKNGKLQWKELFERPIHLAENGFRLSGEWVERTNRTRKLFSKGGIKAFFKKDESSYLPGEILKQNGLAEALKLIAKKGPKAFYEGEIAKDIVNSVNSTGGDFELSDMKNYKTRPRKPLVTEYAGAKIYLMPPPSSGGIMIKMALDLFEKLELSKYKPLSVDELHLMGESMARVFRYRTLLGDPDFHKNPIDILTSQKLLSKLHKSIDIKKTKELNPIDAKKFMESPETTHYSVMNDQGEAVSITVTLNGNYGSGVVSEKFGIALNNEMDDFTTKPGVPNMFGLIQGDGNHVAAGKRPLSSMSPTLVERNGQITMAIGSPGGPRIINAVLQVLHRVLVNQMDLDRAIQSPRVHHQFLPYRLYIDGTSTPYFPPETIKGLEAKGHRLKETWVARVYAVKAIRGGLLEAAHDSRGEGASGGY